MSRPEETLEQLARLAREEEALHAAIERRTAQASTSENDPLLLGVPEALAEPLSDVRQSAIVDAIQARFEAARASGEPAKPSEPLRSVPRAQNRRVFAVGAALTAVAAAVFMFVGRAPPAIEPLARYDVRVEGAQQPDRRATSPNGPLRLRPGSRLRFDLRPSTDVHGVVRARLFVQGVRADGKSDTKELRVSQEQSAAGALRIDAAIPSPLGDRGEILLFVGRERALFEGPPNEPRAAEVQAFRWSFQRVE